MEENGIKYKQINIPSLMIFVLAIVLFIMGIVLMSFMVCDRFALYSSTKTNTSLAQGITFIILLVYCIYGLIINIWMFVLSNKMTLEKHPTLYPLLTFTTLNIPCGFLLIKSIRENSEVDE